MILKLLIILSLLVQSSLAIADELGECSLLPHDEAGRLAATFTTTCFNQREAMASSSTSIIDSTPEPQVIATDINVCKCLKSNQLIASVLRDAPNLPAATISEANDPIRAATANAQGVQNQIMSEMNGMIFQASLFSSESGRAEMMRLFNMSSLTADTQRSVAEANQQLERKFPGAGPMSAGIIPELLSPEAELAAGSCITNRELQTFNQVPGQDFFEAMTNSPMYADNDWNYTKLEDELKALRRSQNTPGRGTPAPGDPVLARVKILKARMQFLNSNVLYKNLFLSESKSTKITNAKKDLFTQIQKTYESSRCRDTSVDAGESQFQTCPLNVSATDKLADLTKESSRIFADPAVRKEAVDVGTARARRTLADAREMVSEIPARPMYFLGNKSTSELMSCRANIQSGEVLGKCLTAFGSYCRGLQTLPEYSDGVDASVRYDVYNELGDNKANRYAASVQENLCRKPHHRVLADGTVETATFDTFKTEYCNRSPQPKACTPKAYRLAILSQFIKEYPVDATRSLEGMTAEQKIEISEQSFEGSAVFRHFLYCQDSFCPDNRTELRDGEFIVTARSFKPRDGGVNNDLNLQNLTNDARSATADSPISRLRNFDSLLARANSGVQSSDTPRPVPTTTSAASRAPASASGSTRVSIAPVITPISVDLPPTAIAALRAAPAITNLNLDQARALRDQVIAGTDVTVPKSTATAVDNLDPVRAQLAAEVTRLGSRTDQISALNKRVEELEKPAPVVAEDEDGTTTGPRREASPGRTTSGSSGGTTGGQAQGQVQAATSIPTFGSGSQTFAVAPSASRSTASGSDNDTMTVKYEKTGSATTPSGLIVVGAAVAESGEGPQVIDQTVLASATDAGSVTISSEDWEGILTGKKPASSDQLVQRANTFGSNKVSFTVSSPKGMMKVVIFKGTGKFLVLPVRSTLDALRAVLPQT